MITITLFLVLILGILVSYYLTRSIIISLVCIPILTILLWISHIHSYRKGWQEGYNFVIKQCQIDLNKNINK